MTNAPALSTPREIDEHLAKLHQELASIKRRQASAVAAIYHAAGARRSYHGRDLVYDMTFEQATTRLSQVTTDHDELAFRIREAATALDAYDNGLEVIADKEAEVHEVDKLYTGWSRFFVVTSSPGHIHSSMSCSTCRPTTTYGWLPHLSDKTEAEAVKDLGAVLCSVCFPSAPTEWQGGTLSKKQAEDILAGKTPTAEPKKEYCPGSGQASATPVNWRMYSPRGKCPHCGQFGAVTQGGAMRKHREAKHA